MYKVLLFLLILTIVNSCQQPQTNIGSNERFEKVLPHEDSVLRKQFRQVYGQYVFYNDENISNRIDSKTFYINNYKVTLSSKYRSDSLADSKCYLTIENNQIKYIDTLDFNSSVYIGSVNADIDIYNDQAFICWVSSDIEQELPSEIWLKKVDLKKKQVGFYKNIYSRRRIAIERIALTYNPFNQTIHIAYNDFSEPNDKYLYLGTIEVNNLNDVKFKLSSKSILNHDKWEKRYPKFIRTNNSVFLYNTSGDTWGFFAHTGQQGIGISRIDKNNNAIDYKVLADSNTINQQILIIEDTVFYQHVIKNNSDYEIKKAHLKDINVKAVSPE